ncbi:NrfD/PsrC family molybdoenzyme membrane anchor subunit [Salisediminibacterium beveridgei]|uniref:Nitrite reductase subunit, NrfD superfamily n=1 Tax=Salisediminibacterium beveridgei TaxID=632773 RepID=A0A1D7QWW1_9BACI|nr:NrfD/PsrC family molybdoenzyme membrane anchor subunit [Salisediminibacterium beveridgei]AOM83490.1 nitrite reductase subunit, NrfD superfamily [Salisediminibacterium beveridgei]
MSAQRKIKPVTLAALVGILIVLGIGLFGAVNTLIQGQVVFGSSDEVPWNLLIVAYVFLALMASGMCMFASAAHLLGAKSYMFLSKRAIFLAIVVVIPALVVLSLELGRLDRVYQFILNPNLQAPMWWMGAVYAVYVVLLLVEFVSMHLKNEKLMHYMSYFTLAAAIAATSILGGIFAVTVQRPLWFGDATSVFFVLSAAVSGLALLIIVSYFTAKASGEKREMLVLNNLNGLTKILGAGIVVALGFNAWRLISLFYTGSIDYELLFSGQYALMYWGGAIALGLVIPLVMLIASRKPAMVMTASAFVIIGMFMDKYVTIIAGQLVQPYTTMIEVATYSTTPTEWFIFLGGMAGSVLLYLIGVKFLTLDETPGHHEEDELSLMEKNEAV